MLDFAKFPLETRTVKVGEVEQEINFLLIKSPEQWEPATEFKSHFSLRFPGANKILRVPFRGVSYSEWEEIQNKYPAPDRKKAIDPDYDIELSSITSKRQVIIFECATGKKIPGNALEQKVEWLRQLGTSESELLFNQILDAYSGIDDGQLIGTYNQSLSEENGMQVVEFGEFTDWLDASSYGCTFRMQRSFDNYIVEIPLKQFSEERKFAIEKETTDPTPPSKPGKNPNTGMPDMNYPEFNWNDPAWKRSQLAVERKRFVLQASAVLPFEIPGDGIEGQYKWLSDRLLGDIIKFKRFINNELLSYRSRLNFFTKGLGQPS